MSFTYCPSATDIVLGVSLLLLFSTCAVDSNVFKDTLYIVPTDTKSLAKLFGNHLVCAKTPFYTSHTNTNFEFMFGNLLMKIPKVKYTNIVNLFVQLAQQT